MTKTSSTRGIALVEHESAHGIYGLIQNRAIIKHPRYGLLYIEEGFGAPTTAAGIQEHGNAMFYYWELGFAAVIREGDTISSLNDTNDNDESIARAVDGRKRLDLSGDLIRRIVDRAYSRCTINAYDFWTYRAK